jgi:hypothetical protein
MEAKDFSAHLRSFFARIKPLVFGGKLTNIIILKSEIIQNLPLFSSYGSGPKMVKFTSVCVLGYGSTCTAHLQFNFAQIWCAFILRAYLEITEKMAYPKNGQKCVS